MSKFILVFFDDVLVYSLTWEEHLHHLRTIFETFRQHRLVAMLSKCAFTCSTIAYLGHRISSVGVEIDPKKILASQQWPFPTTVRGLCGFLGLTGYYRQFVPHYASLASSLTDLLCKNAFVWTMEATTAFEALKIVLTTTLVL
ncbi:uncharacterized mitochondrial protein AtMg00860-like [Dioscorea cayenensis subsp. rotundata]|uniref:Uncharacterized mitochondrial protein AtMg00860-like n=1 Tax=Dioscorea cayennensis subsp. rotundata TaxID=55577 RepID=A0AB40D7U0_DIOCR|nr:uncharacterized mitochondrial protein AtMg00860-like [Dioscorea cayenensis subsp. rotundata]